MLPRHTLGSCCGHLGSLLHTTSPSQTQTVHNRTPKMYVWAASRCVWAAPDTSCSGSGQWGEKETKHYFCSTCTIRKWQWFKSLPANYIYLWRKVVSFVLFCSYEIHWTWMLQIMFLVSLESSRLDEERCMGLVPWHLDLWCKSSWILNNFFTRN